MPDQLDGMNAEQLRDYCRSMEAHHSNQLFPIVKFFMEGDALDADGANRLRSRLFELEQAAIRVWWEFNQQHPDIRKLKELIAPDGPMPQPQPRAVPSNL